MPRGGAGSRDCCLAGIIRVPLKRVLVSTGRVRSASGANKSAQTKARGAAAGVRGEGSPSPGDGDPNFYAREQILEPDAPARAVRVKTRVRIQLKPATAHGSAARESGRAAFFVRDRNVCRLRARPERFRARTRTRVDVGGRSAPTRTTTSRES